MKKTNVLVWNENFHEKHNPIVQKIYPKGIHGAIAEALAEDPALSVTTATLDDPEQGLSAEVLHNTDVLVYWGHMKHDDVQDEIAARVVEQVQCGMGLIALHSAHLSKPFVRLMGTTCRLRWRESGERERLFVVEPNHRITSGLPAYIELQQEEMYGERFDIPQPDELLFLGWFQSGEVFRSGCAYRRGNGRVFYFQPGHETYPVYHDKNIRTILTNAVHWAAPNSRVQVVPHLNPDPLEPLT